MKLKELYLSLVKEGKKHHVSEIDVRYLIIDLYKLKPASFFLKLDQEIEDVNKIKKVFNELKHNKPLAYITHKAYFLGDTYYVNKDVLIPRMETEELVSLAIKRINQYFPNKKRLNIIDVGTGSGVIAIKLKKELINSFISASEINQKALKIAKRNAKEHHVKINFFNVDTFPNNKDKYDVIISNPPYIKYKKDVDESVLNYEPHEALFINKKNNVYEKIFKSGRFKSPCLMLFEIAPNLVNDLKVLMNKYFKNYVFNFSQDINHQVRFLSILIKE